MEEQRSEEWFEKRRNRITGSIAGACLGINPWSTKEAAMRTLVRSSLGAESEFKGNMATEYGVMNEEHAQAYLELDLDIKVVETGFHTYEEWLGASPDGLIGDDTVLEIKTPFGKRHGGEFKTLEEQPYYYAQVQLEILCTGREKAIFYQWSPYNQKLEYINKDQKWLDENLPKLREFYEQFLVELESPQRHLEKKTMQINDDLFKSLVEEYNELQKYAKRLKEITQQIQQFAEDSGGNIEGYGMKVTKVVRKGSVDYKSIPELKGVDLEAYRKEPSEYWKCSN